MITTDHKRRVSLFGELKQVPITASPRGDEYKIHNKAGRSHGNADCLSRLPLPEPVESVLLVEELDPSPVSAAQTRHCTSRDPTLAHFSEFLMRGWPGERIDPKMAP